MRVRELIEKLQEMDQDAEVVTWDHFTDCGWDQVYYVEEVMIDNEVAVRVQ